jgi:hypothetical protein
MDPVGVVEGIGGEFEFNRKPLGTKRLVSSGGLAGRQGFEPR